MGLAGEWECFNCGHKFKTTTISVRAPAPPSTSETRKPPAGPMRPVSVKKPEQVRAFETSMVYGRETASPPVKSRKKTFTITALVIVAIIVFAFAAYWFLTTPRIPWLFKGAYANYHGEAIILFIPVKLDMRVEVVDYNSTHVKLLQYMKMDTPLGSQEYQNTTWMDLTKKVYEIEGVKLKRTYEQEIYIEGFGTRKCIVYEYESTPSGSLMIYYVDKEVVWPVKITFSMIGAQDIPGLSIDLKITDTNIPGLKK